MAKYADLGERLCANARLAEVHERECWFNGTPCWLWEGAKRRNQSGMLYGTLCVRWKRGPRRGKPRTVAAHRTSLIFFKGISIRKDYVVKHLCNNSLCINPDHLAAGTQKSNARQCVKEGRHYTPFRRSEQTAVDSDIPF